MTDRITREDSVLVIVDVQERIIGTITNRAQVLAGLRAIIKTSNVLKVPIIVSEQGNLGAIIGEVADLLNADVPRVRKLVFSCFGNSEFKRRLQASERKTVLVCGIETHICVMQTALSLLEAGYHVMLLEDASSSHGRHDHEVAIKRARDAGVVVTTTESAIYELTGEAGIPEFKQILPIVKELRRTHDSEANCN